MRKSVGAAESAAADGTTKGYVDTRVNVTYYQAIGGPQAFTYAASNVFTLSSAAQSVVAVTLNGQTLQPSEYILSSSTTVTVTPESVSFVVGDKVTVTYVLTGSFTGTSTQDLEITDATRGLILRSPNGTRYRLTVANGGSLVTTAL